MLLRRIRATLTLWFYFVRNCEQHDTNWECKPFEIINLIIKSGEGVSI